MFDGTDSMCSSLQPILTRGTALDVDKIQPEYQDVNALTDIEARVRRHAVRFRVHERRSLPENGGIFDSRWDSRRERDSAEHQCIPLLSRKWTGMACRQSDMIDAVLLSETWYRYRERTEHTSGAVLT